MLRETMSSSGKPAPIKSDSAYWLSVKIVAKDGGPGQIPLQGGTIEIEAPREFRQGSYRKILIDWVDFYR
jgi:hypothetical protein